MRLLALLLALCAISAAQAQHPTAATITAQRDSVPTTTIVPVQQAPLTLRDTISAPAPDSRPMNHRQRREERARRYAMTIDSLVATRSFAFYPTVMQAVPDGEIRLVYADYFYAYISPVDLEVHLPLERGAMRQVSIMNFDSDRIENYVSAKFQTQWNISFSARDDGRQYDFSLMISTVTGQTELTVDGPDGAMRYVGSVGQRSRER
ncbi:MAG: hypothetical protein IKK27_08395 [Alistipes sp.]|nr:hypothetical protein [Alistipes sp.]